MRLAGKYIHRIYLPYKLISIQRHFVFYSEKYVLEDQVKRLQDHIVCHDPNSLTPVNMKTLSSYPYLHSPGGV